MVLGKRGASRGATSDSLSVASSSTAASPMVPSRGEEETPTMGSGIEVRSHPIPIDIIDVDTEKQVQRTQSEAKRRKKTTSEAWDHFTRFDKKRMVNGMEVTEEWAKCKYCNYEAARNSKNGTSVFLSHIKMHSVKSGQQLLKVEKNGDVTATIENYKYDQEASVKKLYLAIIMHEYPFNIVHHQYFREFILSLRPSFPLRCRNTVKDQIKAIFDEEWKKLYEYFKTVNCCLSATMDMWTSNQNKGYMCVTVHWIDVNWSFQKRIIKFMHVEGRHTGFNMSTELVTCIMRWFIEKKMFALILDNAAANEVCVNHVIKALNDKSPLLCGGAFFHVRCANHILNLVVRDGLQQISSAVSNIRSFVLAVKSSPPLWEEFMKCAAECDLKQTKGLPLDVQTRWNSTYKMLREALYYRRAFQRLYELDKKRYEKFVPSTDDWDNAFQLCRCLKKFDDLTELFSCTLYPTANLFYKGFCEVKVLIAEWCTSGNEIIRKMANSMNTKFNKYWDKSNIALAVAFFLDPRFKKIGVEHYMKRVYGPLLCSSKVEELMIAVKQLYAAYDNKSDSNVASRATSSANVEPSDLLEEEDRDEYYESMYGGVDEERAIETDLDKYMSEPALRLPKDAFDSFDVLSWWKTNQEVYHVLSKLARDVLAIQVSTVASESAFSVGGRGIDPYRSRLDPVIVEALICTKDWFAATRRDNKKLGSILHDLDVVETLIANFSLEDLLEQKEKQLAGDGDEDHDINGVENASQCYFYDNGDEAVFHANEGAADAADPCN